MKTLRIDKIFHGSGAFLTCSGFHLVTFKGADVQLIWYLLIYRYIYTEWGKGASHVTPVHQRVIVLYVVFVNMVSLGSVSHIQRLTGHLKRRISNDPLTLTEIRPPIPCFSSPIYVSPLKIIVYVTLHLLYRVSYSRSKAFFS